jgi:hypothetical protein
MMEHLWANTAQFQQWKAHNAACVSCETPFEEWVFVQAAGVLFAQKAGELLTLPAEQFSLPMAQRLACLERLAVQWGVACRVVQQNDVSSKVVIYRPTLVQARLHEVPPTILCGTLGYACTITPDAFVDEVGQRWQEQGSIPHEIGLALGYPVKDVLGYMGLQPLECTGSCGWRVYGDPKPSLAMSRACQDATRCALRFLYQPASV